MFFLTSYIAQYNAKAFFWHFVIQELDKYIYENYEVNVLRYILITGFAEYFNESMYEGKMWFVKHFGEPKCDLLW